MPSGLLERDVGALLCLVALNAPLDLAHVVQVGRPRARGRARRAASAALASRRGSPSRMLRSSRRLARRSRVDAAVAEQPLERAARIDLHRQRRRRRRPRDRVVVRAAVAGRAAADVAGEVFGARTRATGTATTVRSAAPAPDRSSCRMRSLPPRSASEPRRSASRSPRRRASRPARPRAAGC